jgi:protein-disulfide isomerase
MPAENERRTKLLQWAAGAVFLAIVAVAVLIVVNSSGGGGDTNLEGKAEMNQLLKGIPQEGLVLGDQGIVLGDFKAPVELVEYGDLQCPVCRGYSEDVLPPIIENQVKKGQVRIVFLNFTIIGEESIAAGAAALAAGKQGRGWNYVELFYRNQGEENSGYVTDDFLKAVAEGAGVKDIARWERERKQLTAPVGSSTGDAKSLGFEGTPSFVIRGPNTGLELLGTPESTRALEEAIEKAS